MCVCVVSIHPVTKPLAGCRGPESLDWSPKITNIEKKTQIWNPLRLQRFYLKPPPSRHLMRKAQVGRQRADVGVWARTYICCL